MWFFMMYYLFEYFLYLENHLKHNYILEHIFNWWNVMDTLILSKVHGVGWYVHMRLYNLACTQCEVYMCTHKWIKRIVVCEIWTTHQCLWWVCTHVGEMRKFCRRFFVIWEVIVYTCIKLSIYQGIYMYEAIHVSRYTHMNGEVCTHGGCTHSKTHGI